MHTPDLQPFRVRAGVLWVVKERVRGLWVVKRETHNVVTAYGTTALALAPGGGYLPPTYLVIETTQTTLAASYSSGVNAIQLAGDPTQAGDTQLVLSLNTANQETVTFTSKSGTGPYTFNLSANTGFPHNSGDYATRAPVSSDTMANVVAEAQYDPTNAPGLRSPMSSSYSPATGQGTMQFFLAGITATNLFFAHVGLADASAVGAGNLHNYAALGYNHNNTNDVEIDVTWTVTGL